MNVNKILTHIFNYYNYKMITKNKGSQTTAFNPSVALRAPPPIYKGGDYSVLPFSWWTNF